MRVYKVKLEVKGKIVEVAVKGTNMIQLVAACERKGAEYKVKLVNGLFI